MRLDCKFLFLITDGSLERVKARMQILVGWITGFLGNIGDAEQGMNE